MALRSRACSALYFETLQKMCTQSAAAQRPGTDLGQQQRRRHRWWFVKKKTPRPSSDGISGVYAFQHQRHVYSTPVNQEQPN